MDPRIGGSFAPPLSDKKLTEYKKLIDGLPASPVKDSMAALHAMCGKWWELPESKGAGSDHPSGRGFIVPLDAEHVKTLWDHVPWDHELKAMADVFETIDPATDKPLRDAAFHLLWHGVELCKDREPITADKL